MRTKSASDAFFTVEISDDVSAPARPSSTVPWIRFGKSATSFRRFSSSASAVRDFGEGRSPDEVDQNGTGLRQQLAAGRHRREHLAERPLETGNVRTDGLVQLRCHGRDVGLDFVEAVRRQLPGGRMREQRGLVLLSVPCAARFAM
jgi:hypothetical protein